MDTIECVNSYVYWNSLRGKNRAPSRSQIDPYQLGYALDGTFILDVSDIDNINYRVAGRMLGICYGRDLRGSEFINDWDSENRDFMVSLLEIIQVDGPAVSITFNAEFDNGSVTKFEVIYLPLVFGNKGFDRILGVMAPFNGSWPVESIIVKHNICRVKVLWPEDVSDIALDNLESNSASKKNNHQPMVSDKSDTDIPDWYVSLKNLYSQGSQFNNLTIPNAVTLSKASTVRHLKIFKGGRP